MFADSLLECAPKTALRRRLTLLLSFGLQLTAMAVALMVPLLHPERLPRLSIVPAIAIPVHRGEATAASHEHSTQSLAVRPVVQFVMPRNFSRMRPPQANGGPELPGPNLGLPAFPESEALPLTNLENPSGPAIRLDLAPTPKHPLRISNMEKGSLIRRVQPVYPEPAKRAGIQGAVVLRAIIARDGSIEQLQVISGHPLLIAGALQAVRDWRYRPYVLNGVPVEVETAITVTFTLNHD